MADFAAGRGPTGGLGDAIDWPLAVSLHGRDVLLVPAMLQGCDYNWSSNGQGIKGIGPAGVWNVVRRLGQREAAAAEWTDDEIYNMTVEVGGARVGKHIALKAEVLRLFAAVRRGYRDGLVQVDAAAAADASVGRVVRLSDGGSAVLQLPPPAEQTAQYLYKEVLPAGGQPHSLPQRGRWPAEMPDLGFSLELVRSWERHQSRAGAAWDAENMAHVANQPIGRGRTKAGLYENPVFHNRQVVKESPRGLGGKDACDDELVLVFPAGQLVPQLPEGVRGQGAVRFSRAVGVTPNDDGHAIAADDADAPQPAILDAMAEHAVACGWLQAGASLRLARADELQAITSQQLLELQEMLAGRAFYGRAERWGDGTRFHS